jgi:hypothetical protein
MGFETDRVDRIFIIEGCVTICVSIITLPAIPQFPKVR